MFGFALLCFCPELEVNRSAEASTFKPQGFPDKNFLWKFLSGKTLRFGRTVENSVRDTSKAKPNDDACRASNRGIHFSTAIYQPSAISNLITPPPSD